MLSRIRNDTGDGGTIAEISNDSDGLAPEGLDLLNGVVSGENVDRNDIGASFGESEGHALAKATSSTGDDSNFAVEFELF